MTINFSLICQLFSGSGQIRNTGTNYLSPGLAKIAPWWFAAGTDYRLKYRMTHRRTAPPTLTAHTSGPLYAMRTEHFESKSVFYENTEIIWQKQKQSEKHSVEKLL
jgi:hypothetical protein